MLQGVETMNSRIMETTIQIVRTYRRLHDLRVTVPFARLPRFSQLSAEIPAMMANLVWSRVMFPLAGQCELGPHLRCKT